MKKLYHKYSNVYEVSLFKIVLFLLVILPGAALGQEERQPEPFPMRSGTYFENFSGISNWGNNFEGGSGAERFGVATEPLTALPVAPNQNDVFASNTFSPGMRKAASGTHAIVMLATGETSSNPARGAAAFDLYLDFSDTTAGTISLNWSSLNNGPTSGNRQSIFKIQAYGGSGEFVDLPGSEVTITNNSPENGEIINVPLPESLNGSSNARIRFYLVTAGLSGSGSRPRMQINNITVTTSPALNVTPASLSFGEEAIGRESEGQVFRVTGNGLTDNVTVTPPAGFEIYTEATETYTSNPVTLALSDGEIDAEVAIRFKPMSAQTYNGNVTVASGSGTVSKQIPVSGTGVVSTPVLSTIDPSEVTARTAVTGGEVVSTGGAAITAQGIVWSTQPGPTLDDNVLISESDADTFVSNITNLEQNTLYYVRAYATNSEGTSYAEDNLYFITSPAAPEKQASDITFSNIDGGTLTITWTNGSGTGRLVKINTSEEFTNPTEGTDISIANNDYDAKRSGEQVVYRGNGNSVTVTGLGLGLDYWVRVYELNNTNENVRYNVNAAKGNPASFSTESPFPVELVYFRAQAGSGGTVALEWKTATETNNSHFNITRSTDAFSFKKIGKIDGYGTTAIAHKYSFSDKNTPRGDVYYLLEQVDFDGTVTKSSVISVSSEGSQSLALKAFPNPAVDVLTIDGLAKQELQRYEIFNSAGSVMVSNVIEQATDSEVSCDVSSLPEGMYILRLYTDAGPHVVRFVKRGE
ncbi:T9SS type A sorting domain-containing protein [Pontibacter silvestris]|uniref:T9SS type A sorting domain-containing protein n=1 Tax=Pontibacter silvestris TaxID=2305183 RepID=A0ABW4X086_9BACT|nr:T9SS type A sorting domain-containing protein [Pontibacter silvestris]MCC9135983.1 T9SS type A sorting domain-containing protein [Pontibacter silvestris]